MNKKMLACLVCALLCACSGGGGGSDEGPNFGAADSEVFGVWTFKGTPEENNCVGADNTPVEEEYEIVRNGNGCELVSDNDYDNNFFEAQNTTCRISGNSVIFESHFDENVDQGCDVMVHVNSTLTLQNDTLQGNWEGDADFDGNCGQFHDCKAKASITATRGSNAQIQLRAKSLFGNFKQ